MSNPWSPAGIVSPLPLPEVCGSDRVFAVWMPVRSVHPNSPKSDISRVPLVDPFEASTFVVSKRVEEHAAGRYALATLLRDIGFDPYDLQIIRDQHRKPTLGWRDETARLRAGGVHSPVLPEITLGHSNGVAIAAVSVDGCMIGLDAEPLDYPRPRNLLPMMVSGEEFHYLDQLWDIDEQIGMQETTKTWVAKEAVQKACGLGMHIAPQSFSVLNKEEVTLSYENRGYRLEVCNWSELIGGRSFIIGFSRVIEVV
ncbi:MAG: 4'-phosphopantetheinyl transferase superfamily protein [Candidatus Thalassarchaeaceae archaeon]|jgi:4'-phosphopantetheinyl transferase EntD|nr:4'-phosphopantetheinyl transferase superfamily protein [Candidatus Thalassarchaeaceae archaeon]